MNNWDFKGVYNIIKNKRNPEFWHATNKTHPGIGWNIKTVIPKYEFASDDIKYIIYSWVELCSRHPSIITWCDTAFDWNGNKLDEWQTMWIKDGYDIIPENISDKGIQLFKLTTHIKGNEPALESVLDDLKLQLYKTIDKIEEEEFINLIEIIEVMLTKTNEHDIQEKRNNIKVIDCD